MDTVNCDSNFWYKKLILMFQKDVAERIIAETNTLEIMEDYL